jgi:hypothetical protein
MMAPVLLLLAAPLTWQSREAGSPIPAGAIRTGEALYVCRAQLPDGVHPGVTSGGPCLIPQKGKVQEFPKHEIAAGGGVEWRAADWVNAVVGGSQGRNGDVYICRAQIPGASGGSVHAGGKAYRTGNHAGHCYLAHDGREVDVTAFELLVAK